MKIGTGDEETQFARFVEAQTLWDRAMAEGIARFRQSHPGTRVVGILGAGHIRNGYGVPHQLRDLGQDKIASLVTQPSDQDCAEIRPGLADAVRIIPPQLDTFLPPRLGVALKAVKDGVMIERVMPDSLAQKTGLKDGDVILQAAGIKVATIDDVRGHVYRQPAGTWLPLLIRRGLLNMEVVVRFPPKPESPRTGHF
jgi:membrane-associated protease RseP (regulator of RpoE activity)